MKFPLVVVLVVRLGAACPAAVEDAYCARARDQDADFKAILDDAPGGKPQFETIKRGGNDGIVTITRWVGGEKRVNRMTLHGLFTKVIQTFVGGRTMELAFSPSIDLSKLFPLHPDMSADYRVSIGRSDHFDPKFADAKLSVGAARDVAVGGCKLQALDLAIDWRGTEAGAAVSKTTITYVPALDYSVEFKAHITMHGKDIDNATKVRAIEAWSE